IGGCSPCRCVFSPRYSAHGRVRARLNPGTARSDHVFILAGVNTDIDQVKTGNGALLINGHNVLVVPCSGFELYVSVLAAFVTVFAGDGAIIVIILMLE